MTDRRMRRNIPPELLEKFDDDAELAVQLAGGTLTPERELAVRERLAHDAAFRAVALPILDAWSAPSLAPAKHARAWEELRERIGLAPAVEEVRDETEAYAKRIADRTARQKRISRRLILSFAAVVVFVVALNMGIQRFRMVDHETLPNETGTVVTLPDKSRVLMSEATQIRYAKNFPTRTWRWVALEGEATFEVTPKAGIRFEIHTPAALVTAVGTRFTVRAYREPTVTEVRVHEGTVMVQAWKDGDHFGPRVMLKAGMHARVTGAGVQPDSLAAPRAPVAPGAP